MTDEMLATPTLSAKDMPYVAFYTETIPDPVKTKEDNIARFKDQDFVVVTVPGDTKSNFKDKVQAFFQKKQDEINAGRIPREWVEKWKRDYDLYAQGKEIPLDGTPIKGWKLISGAQQEELVRMNIRTVEELSNMSDDAKRNFGMGALELQRKAKAWLEQNQSHESGAIKLASLTKENESLQGQVKLLVEKMEELEKALAKKGK